MGIYPKPVLDVINPAVHSTMVQIHMTDPTPAHPATAHLTNAQKGTTP